MTGEDQELEEERQRLLGKCVLRKHNKELVQDGPVVSVDRFEAIGPVIASFRKNCSLLILASNLEVASDTTRVSA